MLQYSIAIQMVQLKFRASFKDACVTGEDIFSGGPGEVPVSKSIPLRKFPIGIPIGKIPIRISDKIPIGIPIGKIPIGIPIGKIPIGILSEIPIGNFPIGIFPIGIPIGIPLGKIPIGISYRNFPTGIPIEI